MRMMALREDLYRYWDLLGILIMGLLLIVGTFLLAPWIILRDVFRRRELR